MARKRRQAAPQAKKEDFNLEQYVANRYLKDLESHGGSSLQMLGTEADIFDALQAMAQINMNQMAIRDKVGGYMQKLKGFTPLPQKQAPPRKSRPI